MKVPDSIKAILPLCTINSLLKEGMLFLGDSSDTPALDAALLMMHLLKQNREYLIRHRDESLTALQVERFNSLLKRRKACEPIAHILQKQEFWSIEFLVSKDTLIPRPDSEILIEAVLKAHPDQNAGLSFFDAGTGSGCLLLTLLSLYPNATGQGCDISKGALEVAKKNADSLKLSDRVHFHHRPWDECEGLFDLIISNPPYISQKHMDVLMADVGEFEPHTALFGGSDGLEAYKNLFPYAKTHLKKEGLLVCEHGFDQRESLCELANQEGLSVLDQYDDIGANPRCLVMNVAAG